MIVSIFIPSQIKFTKKCTRCGLLYSKKEIKCTHCANLTDTEVEELKTKFQEEQEANQWLGKLLLYISAVIMLIVLF